MRYLLPCANFRVEFIAFEATAISSLVVGRIKNDAIFPIVMLFDRPVMYCQIALFAISSARVKAHIFETFSSRHLTFYLPARRTPLAFIAQHVPVAYATILMLQARLAAPDHANKTFPYPTLQS